jgi:GNAT superfamily N-acetyltransferase
VGYARLVECGDLAHLDDLAVLPGEMGKGHGSQLLEAACGWADEHGYPAITLTTYAEVSWNAPFFRARGFVEIEPTPALAAVRAREASAGLDAVGPRIAMRRECPAHSR